MRKGGKHTRRKQKETSKATNDDGLGEVFRSWGNNNVKGSAPSSGMPRPTGWRPRVRVMVPLQNGGWSLTSLGAGRSSTLIDISCFSFADESLRREGGAKHKGNRRRPPRGVSERHRAAPDRGE